MEECLHTASTRIDCQETSAGALPVEELARAMRGQLADFLHRLETGEWPLLPLAMPDAWVAQGVGHFHLAAELFIQLAGWTHFDFPHASDACRAASGNCKCKSTPGGKRVLVIGDGRSDMCVAAGADFVLLDGSVQRLPIARDQTGRPMTLRVGDATAGLGEPACAHRGHAPRPRPAVTPRPRRGGFSGEDHDHAFA